MATQSKRGGWKGPKKSKRNYGAYAEWKERKAARNAAKGNHAPKE